MTFSPAPDGRKAAQRESARIPCVRPSSVIGTILSGNLERSNVDLTTELVNLIAAQRNFQASAKAVETDNQLLQTIINLRN